MASVPPSPTWSQTLLLVPLVSCLWRSGLGEMGRDGTGRPSLALGLRGLLARLRGTARPRGDVGGRIPGPSPTAR